MSDSLHVTGDYNSFLQTSKERIQSAQGRAALAVNRELVILYWQVGHDILVEQRRRGGAPRLSINRPPTCGTPSPAQKVFLLEI